MPQLPSGRYVEIMAERARYHARHLNLNITESTPHLQLYPLIDILVDPPNNQHGCRGCTAFSGYTLADRNWINEWDEGDRHFFLGWLREQTQVRVIEQARARMLVEPSAPKEESHNYPSKLYSELQRRIEALPMRRAGAEQWRRTLLNMKRDGIRREELDWSGALEFLSNHQADSPVTKESLLGAIDFTQVMPCLTNELEYESDCHLPFREVAQRIPSYQLQMVGYPVDSEDVGVVRYRSTTPSYRVGSIRQRGRTLMVSEQPRWFVIGPYGRVVSDTGSRLFESSEAAMQVANSHARKRHRLSPELTYSKSYEYMTLHGGEEYREWLVTLPNYHRSHFTAHYYERNVLLHIRTKIRVTEQGSRVLFLEELQSDWQQAMARYGLRSGIPLAPFRKEWISLALKLMLMHAAKSDLDGVAWADASVHKLRYDRSVSMLERIYDQEIPRFLNRLARPWQIQIEQAKFETRSPWLHAARCNECWKVEGGAGKFSTRPRFEKDQAIALIERHSKMLTMQLPLLRLTEKMKRDIAEHGLPMFGEKIPNNP